MKHYISACTDAKNEYCAKVTLDEALRFLLVPENASEEKGGWLFHPAYNENESNYKRWESQMDRFSTIMIDCDNHGKDPDIINKWYDFMGNYDFIIYETYSSTKELPKFRVIIPLDEELPWSKNAKIVIAQTFNQFTDNKATWYFAPTRNKLDTIRANNVGRKFPARVLKEKIDTLNMIEQINNTQRVIEQSKWAERKAMGIVKEHERKDYHELPLIQEYLSSSKGERNSSAHKAACSMFARGYEDYEIKSMLTEGPIDRTEINTDFNSAKRCRR